MKKGSLRLLSIASFACLTFLPMLSVEAQNRRSASPADNDDSCFMVTSSGRTVSLNKLCGSGGAASQSKPATTGSPAAVTATPTNGVVQAKIKRRLGGIPVIDVTFNGKQTYEMIVDTGASGTLITRTMARSLRVPIIGVGRSSIADGSVVEFPLGRLQSIGVSEAVVRNVEVAIADRMEIGLLGHDFFGDYDVKIKRDVVEFYQR